ncbi:general stress protein [Gulosibacter sediminis]|uniref:general stress protein n=1 Tax=Gulosibacter sediminis TaxID=1729695 RepID=UPI0024A8BDC1|nr:general stress protein [Gulosibacter sediminis]
MTSPGPALNSQFPTLPQGRTVGSYQTYEAAKHAVDVLIANEGFSAQSISIIGSDLRSVERVTGRMSIGRTALNGVMTGVMIGLFMSLMWMIVNPITNLIVLVGIFLLSIAFGVIWSLIVYAMTPNKREFTSMMQLTAGRFDIIVPNELANDATSILRGGYAEGQRVAAQQGQGQAWPGAQQQWPGQATRPGASAQVGHPGQPGPSPEASEPESAGEDAPKPAAPAGPPKTYGEMQDELRRKQERGEA